MDDHYTSARPSQNVAIRATSTSPRSHRVQCRVLSATLSVYRPDLVTAWLSRLPTYASDSKKTRILSPRIKSTSTFRSRNFSINSSPGRVERRENSIPLALNCLAEAPSIIVENLISVLNKSGATSSTSDVKMGPVSSAGAPAVMPVRCHPVSISTMTTRPTSSTATEQCWRSSKYRPPAQNRRTSSAGAWRSESCIPSQQNLFETVLEHYFGLAQLCGADANRVD
jgi:hypothetical protein